ncbi:AAA family ATPase [Sphingomonadaceae bacterium OTU29THOMA1]|nr:AAA family ATPase [Sphingomonadaceae bacterium OTU29THOMA1]
MQYAQFRDWLRARGCSDNSVNVRSAEVRMIERAMSGLGSPFDDLDAAYEADEFAGLRHAFDLLRTDMREGGERYRIIFPNTANPRSRITASKNLLGQYGQFRSGATPDLKIALDPTDTYWFVGASFGRTDDQLGRFLAEGVWEISTPKPAEIKAVLAMKVGQKIAIKAAFVQRRNLPFDNRNYNVSIMRIKARGVITDNPGTGGQVSVEWDKEFDAKDWFFYTFRPTIWQVQSGKEMADRLIAFAFHDEPQDIDWFRNQGSWGALFGDNPEPSVQRFWIEKTIVTGRADRLEGDHALGRALWSPQRSKDGKNIYATMLQVQAGDVVFHLTDNEAISSASIATGAADADFIGIEGSDWAGQPGYRIELGDHQALEPPLHREAFLETEPFSSELRELAESGAKGLFYNSRRGLNQGAYLTEATPTLLSILNRAYVAQAGRNLPFIDDERQVETDGEAPPYSLDDALEELFLDRADAEDILLLWRVKKNVILQGPPGVGKSFAAHKLAYALIGVEDRDRVGFVQFHQSYSYEDFVEGFRPTSTGFELKPGKFVEFCRRAEADPNYSYVFVIDEINRGNLSKILGELMLLIEPDKRDQKWSMPLASGKAPFHVPANVHILGLMNTADRSLAVVDYALRRRFAFVSLAPKIGTQRFEQHLEAIGIGSGVRDALRVGIAELNEEIVSDTANLGRGFAIGHSFFCASPNDAESDAAWYRRVIRTEIMPLLQEYWFDAPDKAEGWGTRLLAQL